MIKDDDYNIKSFNLEQILTNKNNDKNILNNNRSLK